MRRPGSAPGPALGGARGRGLVLGLDVGGSKTHAVLSDGATVLGEVLVGSANPSSAGLEEASRQLAQLFGKLGAAELSAVCAGVAGADSPAARERFGALLAGHAQGARVRVVHDAELLLAAAGLATGIALISGTGSAAWGRAPAGATARAGGWGYLLGDEGSGYGVACQALRHALGRADRGEGPDALTLRLLAECRRHEPPQGSRREPPEPAPRDPAGLLDLFYRHQDRGFWAARAGLVFELAADGDAASAGIVAEAADALARLALTVGYRLGIAGPVVLAGGQGVNQPLLQSAVRERLAARGMPELRILDGDPVHGAVRLAQELRDRR